MPGLYSSVSKIACIIILFMAGGMGMNYAQSSMTPEMKQKMLQDMLREKMHTVPQSAEEPDMSSMERTTSSIGAEKKLTTNVVTSAEESETAIIVDPNDSNNLVVSFMSQSTSLPLSFPIYFSSDHGTTWTRSSFSTQFINSTDFPGGTLAGGGDPVFAWDKVSNTLYFGWIYLTLNPAFDTSFFTLNWAYSTDKGHSWQVQPGVNHFIGQGAEDPSTGAGFNYKDGICDREWFAVDNSGGPRQGTLYCAYISFAKGGECVKSKSASATSFGTANLAYGGASQLVNIEVDHTGKLHMTFADINFNILYHTYSSTGGLPFHGPHNIYNGTNLFGKDSIVHGRENAAPSLGIDANNNLHVAWCDYKLGKVYAYYSRSSDSGLHWTVPKRLDSLSPAFSGKMMFMPTITAAGNSVTITVTAIDPAPGDSARVFQFTSTDGGQTWGNWPILLSSSATYYKQYQPYAAYFFGDYNKSVSTSCMAYAIWEDGRKTQGPKVYMATTNHCTLGVNQVSAVTASLQLQSVYPNPASGHIILQFTDSKEEEITVSINDINGKKVAEQTYHTQNGSQNILMPLHLNAGMYVLSVNDVDGLIATRNLQIVK